MSETKENVYFGKYFMWAVLAVTAVLIAIGFAMSFIDTVLYTVLPALYAFSGAVYFLTSFLNKKNGVKSAIYLIILAVLSLIIVAVGYILTKESGTVFYALGSALVSLLGLLILSSKYPKEMDDELKARFHR